MKKTVDIVIKGSAWLHIKKLADDASLKETSNIGNALMPLIFLVLAGIVFMA